MSVEILKKAVEVLRRNWISILIIIVCLIFTVVMLTVLINASKANATSPIEDVRKEVYNMGIEVCDELTTNDSMVELARIYASGADMNSSMYFLKMQELEQLCETAPEEIFLTAVSAIVGLNLDAASLYADHEYEMAEEYQAKAREQLKKLKDAGTIDELNTIIKSINAEKEERVESDTL